MPGGAGFLPSTVGSLSASSYHLICFFDTSPITDSVNMKLRFFWCGLDVLAKTLKSKMLSGVCASVFYIHQGAFFIDYRTAIK